VRIELSIDERRRHVAGNATLTWTAINDGLRTLRLDLGSCMHVSAVWSGKRRLRWEHRNDELHVHLPRAAPMGKDMTLRVDYAGTPLRGLWFTGPDAAHPDRPVTVWSQGQDEDSRFWFPCWDSPNDKFTSEVLVTVRQPFTVIGNGRLMSVTEDKRRRRRTFHWREDFPHPAYLLSVVVGEFHCTTEVIDGIELQYYVHPRDRRTVPLLFGRTPAMMRWFCDVIDYPYPYEKYSQVLVPEFIFGGMENISATTLTDGIRLDATAAEESFSDWLIAHELAHQWWGNLLTCREWSHAWLNEGFATYFEALFTEHHLGREIFQWQMSTQADDYFSEDTEDYRRPVVERRWEKPIEIFDSHLYEKGSLVLHMLRFELGDELFWKALRHYVRRYQFQNVETTDFKTAIEESTGRVLDGFFDQWIHAAGFPHLKASWRWLSDDGQIAVSVQQAQNHDVSTPIFEFPLEIELGYGDRTERLRLRVHHADETFRLPARRRPLYVRLDPDHWILKKLDFEQDRDEWLSQLQHAEDYPGQKDAAAGLQRFRRDTEVVQALARALQRAHRFPTRRVLAQALGRVGGDAARDVLLRHLKQRDARSRRGIVRALGHFRDDAKVGDALWKLWKVESSYIVRAQIVQTLVRLRHPKAESLCRAALRLRSHRDNIRAAALAGLAQLEVESGIDLALKHASPGGSRWQREAALLALAKLARVHPSRARAIEDVLESTLDNDGFFAQLAAAKALGVLGRSTATGALQRAMQSDTDGRLRKAARRSLERITRRDSPEAWKALRREVDDLRQENEELRRRLDRLEGERRAPSSTTSSGRQRRPRA
jgi:aminopeptidase N